MKTKNRSLMALIFAAAFSVAAAQPVSANPVTNVQPPSARVLYLGSNEDQYSFLLVFDNADKGAYIITLKDEAGNMLYSEKTKAPAYRKKFVLENSAIEGGQLTLNVVSLKSEAQQKFVINKKIKTQEEVVVTEIK